MYEHYPFVNQPLPYPYEALEPFIDSKTMEIHHDRHLQTYVNNLNAVLKDYPELQKLTLEQLIYNVQMFPKNIQLPIKNNAGGVYNHEFYFNIIEPSMEKKPMGQLLEDINETYGDYDNFKEEFKAAALSVFGSGYAWLVADRDGDLNIITTANQDTPLPEGYCAIINIDVWEHAYYLKHYNQRSAYIDDWYNVLNWENALENYMKCMSRIKFMSLVNSIDQ
ncbi:MAG: superoxide dismutase [Aminipila sp.]